MSSSYSTTAQLGGGADDGGGGNNVEHSADNANNIHSDDEPTYYDNLINESVNLEQSRNHFDNVAKRLWDRVIAPYIRAGRGILDKLNPDRDFSRFYKFLLGSSELPSAINNTDAAVNQAIEDVNNGAVSYITGE